MSGHLELSFLIRTFCNRGDGTPVPAPASTPTADAPTLGEGKKKKNKKKSPGKEEQVAKTPEPKDNGKAADKTPVKTPTAEAGKASKKDNTPVKKYPNGLEVEELAMGKPDGKQAAPGKKVIYHPLEYLKMNVNNMSFRGITSLFNGRPLTEDKYEM